MQKMLFGSKHNQDTLKNLLMVSPNVLDNTERNFHKPDKHRWHLCFKWLKGE